MNELLCFLSDCPVRGANQMGDEPAAADGRPADKRESWFSLQAAAAGAAAGACLQHGLDVDG